MGQHQRCQCFSPARCPPPQNNIGVGGYCFHQQLNLSQITNSNKDINISTLSLLFYSIHAKCSIFPEESRDY